MVNNLYYENVKINHLKSSKNPQPILSIYEITKRALFAQVLMNHNESHGNMICEKCLATWENYYDYLSKYFDEIIPRYMLENNLGFSDKKDIYFVCNNCTWIKNG